MTPARAAAARAVAAVLGGRALDDAVNHAREQVPGDDGPLVQELAYGTVRHWFRLEPVVATRLRRPLKRRDADLRALMVMALYELDHMSTPPHAAVDAAVSASLALGKEWARGLVNAVLRGVLRDPEALDPPEDPARAGGWPDWLARIIEKDWPDDWPAIARSGVERPPMTLRVNRAQTTRKAYREALRSAGIDSTETAFGKDGVVLARPVPVERLPGFAEGMVSVQDAAAQLAAPLLAPVDGLRLLDACAAPGGKTSHLAELGSPAELVAVEREPARAEQLRAGLTRLGVDAQVVEADAARPGDWWDGRPFDRILLDAPCSGTGVIRRHPDIRLLRRADDLPKLCAAQDRLLDAMWPLLAPAGILVYATCSILRRENAQRIEGFLERHPDARHEAIDASWGRASGPGRQILPGEETMDGFFYARLARRQERP